MTAGRSSRAGRPNADEAAEKQKRMIESALDEFASAGFNGASVRVIADKAGQSTRTMYNRYPDKVALFQACLDVASTEIELHVVTDANAPLRERLLSYAIQMQTQLFSERSIKIARLIYREGGASSDLQDIARRQFYRYQLQPVETILKSNGYAPDTACALGMNFVVMAFSRWQRTILFNEPILDHRTIAQQSEATVDFFLRGAEAFRSI